jgi:predicted nuclease with TOPRIM domain
MQAVEIGGEGIMSKVKDMETLVAEYREMEERQERVCEENQKLNTALSIEQGQCLKLRERIAELEGALLDMGTFVTKAFPWIIKNTDWDGKLPDEFDQYKGMAERAAELLVGTEAGTVSQEGGEG